MLRFTIPLDSPEWDPNASLAFLVERARLAQESPPPPSQELSEKCAAVIRQGSVWLGNQRVKRVELSLAELRQAAQTMNADNARSDKEPINQLQVFWPELPIFEYAMDPSQIIWEDRDLLIVYKPPGLNSCQSIFSDTYCLTWGVQKLLDSRAGFPSDPLNAEQALPGRYVVNAINRLDWATRGLVFYAKHKTAEIALHRMFMKRRVHKRYLVGTAPVRTVAATPGYRRVINDSLEWKGKLKPAVTLAQLLACGDMVWWWAALPQTGRTHQIRKHFAQNLVPIIGDGSYGDPADEPPLNMEAAGGLLLACVEYRFRHPLNHNRIKVAYIPAEFRSAFDGSG